MNHRRSISELNMSWKPLGDYGSLEGILRQIRDARPLDLNAEIWRIQNPKGSFKHWQEQARRCLLDGLHYQPGSLELKTKTLERREFPHMIMERVEFNTTPWNRVTAYFLLPRGISRPVPGLVVFHEWGGPMAFGKDRVVNSGRDHPTLAEHRRTATGGKYLAEEFVKAGYAVIVIDAWHFGERIPKGLGGIPPDLDPYALSVTELGEIHEMLRKQLYLGVRQLNWAGTTWMGVNYWDDSRCVDYLLSRPEVDPERIGCTGLSGGGWRTNVLGALDSRIKASVSVGWMTTGDHQQLYNITGSIGTFCMLPGVWDRLDVPDLTAMSAPCASMVVTGQKDILFPLEGQHEAARQIRAAYEWAGVPNFFTHHHPDKEHCYDVDIQAQALSWFERHLKTSH